MRDSKDILGKELYIKIKNKIGDKKIIIDDENYIPRSRLNQVIHQKNVFRKNIETLSNQLEEMREEIEVKKQLIKRLEKSEERLIKENSKVKDICLAKAIKLGALKMNAKNIHVVSMLIDKVGLKILEDGKVKGLEEQLNKLKEDQKDLFTEDILISLMDIQDSVGNLIQRKLTENL
ncbi:phage scaffolding protein [Wukongibacter baidiensis]|uniref:phage scaffolding protein n=1 Tax=Wukongibacter baidiensis TaxID=1723361 RepID=UPI003D7FA309